jgi:putative ABC transport system ATP-binding protein
MLELRKVRRLFRNHGSVVVGLGEVSLVIDDGDYVRIEGPNGSGKTTLLNLISGSDYPDSGQVLLDGTDITRLPVFERRFLARLFQNASDGSCDDLTILESLSLAQIGRSPSFLRGAINRQRQEAVLSIIKSAGMNDLAGRLDCPLRYLSGGERQVVNLLFLQLQIPMPRFILADEPTNHLDPDNALRVLELLARLSKTSSVLLVSHDEQLEVGLTRIVRLDRGRVIRDERV